MAEVGTGNPDDALDIVQDAMMSLVQRYSQKPSGEWRPLFFRILSNAIADHHRKRVTKQKIFSLFGFSKSEEDDSERHWENYRDPLADEGARSLFNDRQMEQLDRTVHKLPARQQQAFLLRCWEGCSTRETAEIMNCSEGSVKTHYFRALTELKRQLGEFKYE